MSISIPPSPNKSVETNRRPALPLDGGGNSGTPRALHRYRRQRSLTLVVGPIELTLTFMAMGGPGDHPIGDLIHWGRNPFPPDIADMIRRLHSYDAKIREMFALDAFDWEAGRALDEGRAKLRAELEKHEARKI